MKRKRSLAVLITVMILLTGFGTGSSVAGFAETTVSFSDVYTGNPYYAAIIDMAKKGIMPGKADGKFYPNEVLKGQEVAEILFKAIKISIGEKDAVFAANSRNYITPFQMPFNHWSFNYIRTYYNFFNKEKNAEEITKEEFLVASIATRRFDYNEKGKVFAKDPLLYTDAGLNMLADKGQITDIYRYFVELAIDCGIVKTSLVNGNQYIYPQQKVTRGMAAQMIYDAMNSGVNHFIQTAGKLPAPRITARKRDIKVGIIIFDSSQFANNQTDANPDYTIFEALDRNINKPMDWNLMNPHPGRNASGKYYLKQTSSSQPSTDTIDQSEARKELFKYWEVKLSDVSADSLANDYDVLFQTSHKTITMSNDDKSKIQNFINKGGQMFWENCDGLVVNNNFVNFGFVNDPYINSTQKIRYDQVPENINNLHPLLDSVYTIDPYWCGRNGNLCPANTEISRLGDLDEYQKRTAHIAGVSRGAGEEVVVKNINPSNKSQDLPSMVCKSIGQGRLVISANDTACGICDIKNGGGNGVEDYKFWYNLIGWMSRTVVDFNEMEGVTWVNVDPYDIKITATITNLGTKEKDYFVVTDLDPYRKGNNWELKHGSYTADGVLILAISGGYPGKIHLEPGESMNITYNLRITTIMWDNFDYQFQVKAEDDLVNPKDMDFSTYTLHTGNVPLTTFNMIYDRSNNYISAGTEPSINSSFEMTIKSPLSSPVAYAIEDTYEINLSFYKLASDGAQKTQIAPLLGFVSDNGSNIEGFTVERGSMEGNVIKLTLKGIKYMDPDQIVKLKAALPGLSNKTTYVIEGYVERTGDGKETTHKSIDIPVNYTYGKPVVSGQVIETSGNNYTVRLNSVIPQYTDLISALNMIEIYKKVKKEDGSVALEKTNSYPVGTPSIVVPKYDDWYAKITTHSKLLDSVSESDTVQIVEKTDIN